MSKLEVKGEQTRRRGRRKQIDAAKTGNPLKRIEGKEEELVGKLQKRFGKGEEEILMAMDEAEEEDKGQA